MPANSFPTRNIQCAAAAKPALLKAVAAASAARLTTEEDARRSLEAEEDAKVTDLENQIADLQRRLVVAHEHRAQVLTSQDAMIDEYRATAAADAESITAFRRRVALDGIEDLTKEEVFELMSQINFPVDYEVLAKEDVTGIALVGITETEMREAFGMTKLGDRRRLHQILRRLASGGGFDDVGTLDWDVDRVCAWLRDEGVGEYADSFRRHAIDGEVLLTLDRDDLRSLGVSTMGGVAKVSKKLEGAKKQHYAGQVVSRSSGSASVHTATLTDSQQRMVLEQVLQENGELQTRLDAMRERFGTRDGVPEDFYCPITTEVMDDPVFAADGYTYERSAIATWFQRSDSSPMTREVIPPTLIPNRSLRSRIAELDASYD